MTIYLYVKTHNKTGLKYLGKTERDPFLYKGSGTYWKKHIKTHGDDIHTEIIFQSNSKDEIREQGLYYSTLWNIVESKDWANFRPEIGDGGDTVSDKMWITNEKKDSYIIKTTQIPEGWRKGRCGCVFNDPIRQREFGKKADLKTRGAAIKRAWDSGKMDKRNHSKCGRPGDSNSSKRPEVRQKISDSMKKYYNERKTKSV